MYQNTGAPCEKTACMPISHRFPPLRASASPCERSVPRLKPFRTCAYFWNLRLLPDGTENVKRRSSPCAFSDSDILIDCNPPSFGGGFFCLHVPFQPFRIHAGGAFFICCRVVWLGGILHRFPTAAGVARDSQNTQSAYASSMLRRDKHKEKSR